MIGGVYTTAERHGLLSPSQTFSIPHSSLSRHKSGTGIGGEEVDS